MSTDQSFALLMIIVGLLLPKWSIGQPAVWEQKLDLHGSCTPDAIVGILAIAAGEDGTVYLFHPRCGRPFCRPEERGAV